MGERLHIEITGDSSSYVRAAGSADRVTATLAAAVGIANTRMTAGQAILNQQRRNLQTFSRWAGRATAVAGGFAIYGVARLAKQGIQLNAQWESINASFRTFLGSTQQATKFVERLRKVSMKSPIRLTEYAEGARLLLGFGVAAKDVVPLLEAVNMAVVATGKGEAEMMQVVNALGQMQARGKASAEELNQLAQVGVPVNKILQRELGLTGDQVANIGEEGVKSQRALDAIVRGWTSRYADSYRDAADTFNFQTANLVKNFEQVLRLSTEPLFNVFRDRWLPVLNRTAQDIVAIWERRGLTPEEKFESSFRVIQRRVGPLLAEVGEAIERANLPKIFGDVLAVALPRIAETGARMGIELAKAFGRAFVETDLLGKLFLGGLFIRALGGWALFGVIGRQIGRRIGLGTGAGMAGGVGAAKGGFIAAIAVIGAAAANELEKSLSGGDPVRLLSERITQSVKDQTAAAVEAMGVATEAQRKNTRARIRLLGIEGEASRETVRALLQAVDRVEQGGERWRRALRLIGQAYGGVDRGSKQSQEQMRDWLGTFERGMGAAGRASEQGTRKIDRAFGQFRDTMRDAGRNADSFARGTTNGLAQLMGETNKSLKSLGVKKQVYEASFKGGFGGTTTGGNRRRGGTVVPGQGSGDKVPLTLGGVPAAMVEPGEGVYVVNRNAQRVLEATNAAVPRFQEGGGLQPGISALVKWAGKNLGLNVSSGRRAGPAGASWHNTGEAADFVPPSMRATTAIFSKWRNQLEELFYDPWGGWDSGRRIGAIGGHMDHIHAAILGGGKGGVGGIGAVERLKRVVLEGPAGPFLDMGQAALDEVHRGANAFLAKQSKMGGPHVGGGVLSPAEFIRVALQALKITGKFGANRANAGKLLSLGRQESGLDPRAINLWDSNAASGDPSKGLMQVIGSTFKAYHQKGTSMNAFDPLANIAASINYQAARYGHLVTNAPYAKGGLVAQLAQGGFVDLWGKGMAYLQGGGGAKGEQGKGKGKKESRAKKIKKRLKKIKELGAFPKTDKALTGQQLLTDTALDFADRYSSTENVPLETKWVQAYLARMVTLRNLLIDALDQAKRALADLAERLKAAEKAIRQREKALRKMERPQKRKNEKPRDYNKRLKVWQERREKAQRQLSNQKKVKGAIEETIGDESSGAKGSQSTWKEALTTLHGLGSPMAKFSLTQLASMPLGTLGGDILGAQTRLRELGRREDEGEDTGRESLLEELLRQSQARSRLLAAQVPVLSDFLGSQLPFVGAFHSGGIVPLPRGQEGLALVQGQERITPEGAGGIDFRPTIVLKGDLAFAKRVEHEVVGGRTYSKLDGKLGRSGRQRAVGPGRG